MRRTHRKGRSFTEAPENRFVACPHETSSPRSRARVPWSLAALIWLLGHASGPGLGVASAASPREESATRPTSKPQPTPIVLRGEVVDTACFVMGGRKGLEHKQCAIACARSGQDLGILDEKTKTLYVAVIDRREEHAKNPLLPYVADRVQVRGTRVDRGTLPAVVVRSVERISGAR